MATFHLRPVSDNSPSPSPSTSTTPPGDHSPASFKGRPGMLPSPSSNTAAVGRARRPLSPSSLRDVDLTPHSSDPPLRKYPAPPTGHDLMAMFPPPPPELFPEMRPGPTSGFFQRQERAFFAQAGKEIVRVRVELDISDADSASSAKMRAPAREQSAPPRPWPQQQLHPAPTASASSGPGAPGPNSHASPSQSSSSPLPYPPQNMRSGRQNVPMTSAPLFPSPHSQHSQPPPNLHPPPTLHHPTLSLRTPGQETGPNATPKQEFPSEEYREDPDEAWRRPMPYAERRRAGKHTRRVIVKN